MSILEPNINKILPGCRSLLLFSMISRETVDILFLFLSPTVWVSPALKNSLIAVHYIIASVKFQNRMPSCFISLEHSFWPAGPECISYGSVNSICLKDQSIVCYRACCVIFSNVLLSSFLQC